MTDDVTRTTGADEATATPTAPIPVAERPPIPVRTEPVRGSTTSRMPRARIRWVIASLVTIVVLVVSAAGLMVLSAGAATSALVGYVPANSVGYLEIRLDAPGDQHQNTANLLSHFPGFADQSSLGTKLDQALDQLVSDATKGEQTFTGNIKTWLGDSVAVVTPRIEPVTPGAAASSAVKPTKFRDRLLLVSVSDPAAARTWADATFGPGSGSETYAGIPLTQITEHGATLEYGVVSTVLLAGDPESVHDAIDSKGGSAFAESASFKAAAAAVPGDRLAFGYLDLRAVADAVDSSGSRTALATKLTLEQLPAWVAVTVRSESDSLNATVALPDTNLAPTASNHSSALASKLPASTIAAGEIHDLATLLSMITTSVQAPADASPSASPDPIASALQAVGGIDALVGWIGDATVVAVHTGPSDIALGAVLQAKDAKEADTKIAELKNLVALGGASLGVKMTDETYNGVTISVADLGDITRFQSLVSQAGPAAAPASPVDVKIAIARKDDLVIVGIGDSFVKAVLDTKPGQSLADQDTYKTALDKAGSSNTGQLFVDIHGLLDVAANHMSSAQRARYESDIKPYLDPFRAFAAAGSAGDPNRARFVITVK